MVPLGTGEVHHRRQAHFEADGHDAHENRKYPVQSKGQETMTRRCIKCVFDQLMLARKNQVKKERPAGVVRLT